MRRTLLPLLALALGTAATPAVAETAEPVAEPCTAEQVEAADFVLTLDGLEAVVPTPTSPSPYPLGLGGEPDPAGFQAAATDVHTVLLDLSPDFTDSRVTVDLDWAHTGDIDLDVRYGNQLAESHSFNPQEGNGESATITSVDHCDTFTVEIRNYIATPGDITMSLSTSGMRAR